MPTTIKRGQIEFPADWKHIESRGSGQFITRIVHQLEDSATYVWSSRRHRKGFGLEVVASGEKLPVKNRPSLVLWEPAKLNWWIAFLFMAGSLCFVFGSVLILVGYTNLFITNTIFFGGSIFFTSASYLQYNQSINALTAVGPGAQTHKRIWVAWQPSRLDFWVTFSQFLGTVMFNFNTFDAFLGLGWLGQDLVIWVPDMAGSILFQISGTLAVFEICHRWWCWQRRSISWVITMINFVGCVAFFCSAVFAFVWPSLIFKNLVVFTTIFTLIGAICFFVGAYLMWPEMSVEATENMGVA
ncbi:MAG: hypothetical protein GY710_09740 [Desulfobacteraceae bacterium]|nr:hypothetical protein [Desulfobacteraceae bacterium]